MCQDLCWRLSILLTVLKGRHYSPHFTAEEIGSERQCILPRTQRWQARNVLFNPYMLNPQSCTSWSFPKAATAKYRIRELMETEIDSLMALEAGSPSQGVSRTMFPLGLWVESFPLPSFWRGHWCLAFLALPLCLPSLSLHCHMCVSSYHLPSSYKDLSHWLGLVP